MAAAKKRVDQLEFPIAFRHKNMAFNKSKQVWAFYRMKSESLRLNSDSEYTQYIRNMIDFLSNDEYQYHLSIIPRRFDFEKFTEVVKKDIVSGEFADIGERYFTRASEILRDEVFLHEYDVYVSVQINKSDQVVATDVNDLFKKFMKRLREDVSKVMNADVHVEDDVELYEKQEQSFVDRVSYAKEIERVEGEELDRLIYYMFHRTSDGFEIPDGEYNLTEGIIRNTHSYMTVDHGKYTEYLCFLPFKEMPVSLEGFRFIQSIYEQLDFPLEMQIRYDFKQNDQNIREVRKLKRRFKNFDEEIAATRTADEDVVVELASERLDQLLDDVKDNSRKILFMTFTLVVSDRSKEGMESKVESLQNIFKNTGFKLVRPAVDQLTLFTQSMPASDVTYRYFEQVVDETYLAQSGMDLTNRIGNRYGMYLGKVITNRRLSNVQQSREINNNIVIFNPLLTKKAIKGAAHTNGNILITGPPGSGKSMLVKNFFTWSTFFGSKVLYIDPKNEFQRYYKQSLKKNGHIDEFRELYERINFIHLSEEKEFHGALDPLVFLEGDKAIQTAVMIFNTLAGSISGRDESVSIFDAVIEEVNEEKKPTMSGALKRLTESSPTLAKDISRYRYGLGRMLFGDKTSTGLNFTQQVNVLGMQGLSLPETEDMTDEQRIGLCLMMSISKYVNTFSRTPEEEAMIIFDEAWTLTKSKHGESLINEMLRTGRSLRTDIVLVTQAYNDVNTEEIKEQIGVKFAFRPKSDDAILPILRFFDLEENQQNINVVNHLKSGMCLFQDYLGRTQAIAHDVLFEEWFEAFKTTDKESEAVQLEEAR
ncbi:conserved large VirB4 domain protein (plasmid) [Alkalihalophilus pseudofirmus OF4]|uniref:Conserved large VirB4 domain protein n=1 Tax=Alkalihalophilus pseudofirmus (strain ATCC BAA-2126 / JCM 17055 / OF4) TaxID=398511 RepID=D3G202_ALKPO|nr:MULTISPECIES: ATP-binding protein [Alkalihalophilus]ADC52378.1 conserved large VirB4 domain protein [Alkalihalophilus pseudofirmus OF4]MED1603445.1 ATP-binding protein [Alkalihalophilus marmarensis]